MYWSPKRNHLVVVTWNFMKASKVRKKMWWRKWRLWWTGCFHTSTDASPQVSVEGVPHRACFLELSRSFHCEDYSPHQEWESSHKIVITGNIWLRVEANRNNEIRMDFLATQSWTCLKYRLPSPTQVYQVNICMLERSPGNLNVYTF